MTRSPELRAALCIPITLCLMAAACTGRAVESIGECDLTMGQFRMEAVTFNCQDILDDVDIIPLDIETNVRGGPCPRQWRWTEQHQILVDKDHLEPCEVDFTVTYDQLASQLTGGTFTFMMTCESTWCSGDYRWTIEETRF